MILFSLRAQNGTNQSHRHQRIASSNMSVTTLKRPFDDKSLEMSHNPRGDKRRGRREGSAKSFDKNRHHLGFSRQRSRAIRLRAPRPLGANQTEVIGANCRDTTRSLLSWPSYESSDTSLTSFDNSLNLQSSIVAPGGVSNGRRSCPEIFSLMSNCANTCGYQMQTHQRDLDRSQVNSKLAKIAPPLDQNLKLKAIDDRALLWSDLHKLTLLPVASSSLKFLQNDRNQDNSTDSSEHHKQQQLTNSSGRLSPVQEQAAALDKETTLASRHNLRDDLNHWTPDDFSEGSSVCMSLGSGHKVAIEAASSTVLTVSTLAGFHASSSQDLPSTTANKTTPNKANQVKLKSNLRNGRNNNNLVRRATESGLIRDNKSDAVSATFSNNALMQTPIMIASVSKGDST